jgi:hypothetical protein
MTLEEYLIRLGWNIDEPSFKKFVNAVSATSKLTAEVGGVALETAGAIELMVTRVARQYETLYYVSQRTNQSVRYIQATQYAFGQIGLSADDASSAIENFGAKMRTQPWLRAVLGGATTPQQVVQNLSKSGLPYFLQAQFAEQFAGIPEQTYFHMLKYQAAQAQADAEFRTRQGQAGIDPDAFAKRISEPKPGSFIWSLNRLESDLGIFGQRMAMDFVDPAQRGIDTVDRLVQWLNRADAATKGWLGTLETLAGTVAGSWVLEGLFRKVFGLGGKTLAGRVVGTAARAVGITGGLAGGATVALAGGALLASTTAANQDEASRPWNQPLGAPDTGGAGATKRINQAIAYFMAQGYSQSAAQGIASALFFESGKTLSPTAFNGAGGGAGARGIGQWRGERLAAFRKMFGKDPLNATFEEQLQFVAWELAHGTDKGALSAGKLLRGGKLGAGQSAGTFIDMFERPGDNGQEAGRASRFAEGLSALAAQQHRGTTNNVTVTNKTDIHVSGVGAQDAANKVATAQDKVGQDTARSVVGALR